MDWIHCQSNYDQKGERVYFSAYGGPENLEEILAIFKEWGEK